ncbi:MAG: TIM barrel protein, partial [Candidatus Aureabacteria bacterium]|nr:TIM barrel protein [Candidatus Auribacterota bacterium]
MLALSTSWNADGRFTPRGLLAAVRECGVAALELSYSHTAADLAGIVACCRESSVRVVSVHNFCPCPEKVAAGRSRSEAFLLSSSDETERRMAVEATRRSIATAASLGVKALILHLGRVEVPCRTRELIELYRRGKQGERRYAVMKDRMREERSRHAQPFIDRVVRSLEELCPAARDAGVSLCVENRYYYREIPGLDDIRG